MGRGLQRCRLVCRQAHFREGGPGHVHPSATDSASSGGSPGHYVGKTADNEAWAFDVSADGLSSANLQTGQMNESCNPPNYYLYGGQLSFKGPFAIARDGSFTINTTLSDTVGSSAATDIVAITGRTADGVANGTYRKDTSYSTNGIGYSCSTGNQTWTASRTP